MRKTASDVLRRRLIWAVNRTPESVAAQFATDSSLSRYVRPLFNRFVTDEAVPVSIRTGPLKGATIVIRPRDEKFYWTGTHEPWVQETLGRLVGVGAKFWDVGAHVGFFTLLASRLVGPSGEVHAFEPVYATRARLQRTISLNLCRNVQVHEMAIAAESGLAFMRERYATSMSSLVHHPEVDDSQVPCQTLEAMAERLALRTSSNSMSKGLSLQSSRVRQRSSTNIGQPSLSN